MEKIRLHQNKSRQYAQLHAAIFTYSMQAKGHPITVILFARNLFRLISHGLFRLKPQWDINRNEQFLDPQNRFRIFAHGALTEVKRELIRNILSLHICQKIQEIDLDYHKLCTVMMTHKSPVV